MLLEQEILSDDRSHATRATQLRGHDGQVKQREQEFFHARDSVGQTAGATQRCFTLDSARELGIRDGQGSGIRVTEQGFDGGAQVVVAKAVRQMGECTEGLEECHDPRVAEAQR